MFRCRTHPPFTAGSLLDRARSGGRRLLSSRAQCSVEHRSKFFNPLLQIGDLALIADNSGFNDVLIHLYWHVSSISI